jgi:hypothetical protein
MAERDLQLPRRLSGGMPMSTSEFTAVSGASGFIGRHVLSALLQHDVEVVALCRDRASLTGWQERVEVVELDHASPPEQAYALMGRPDVLLHLAWQGLPNYQSLHHFEQELPRQYAFCVSWWPRGCQRWWWPVPVSSMACSPARG